MLDLEVLGSGLGDLVLQAVRAATAPLAARCEALEARNAALSDEVAELRAVEAPQPIVGEKGEAGKDGADATDEQVERAVAKALAPVEGRFNPIAAEVQRYFETFPPPPGERGEKGEAGEKGEKGDKGDDGKDGEAGPVFAAALKDHEGELILTLTDGTVLKTGIFDGQPGKDGEAGRDGFSLDAFDTELKEDGRTLLLKFSQGDTTEIHELQFPVVIDRGVYRPEMAYAKGDGVTWGGSFFIAQRDTLGEKPEVSEAWRLAVKRGRDGKAGEKGEKGETGKQGEAGVDRRY